MVWAVAIATEAYSDESIRLGSLLTEIGEVGILSIVDVSMSL